MVLGRGFKLLGEEEEKESSFQLNGDMAQQFNEIYYKDEDDC